MNKTLLKDMDSDLENERPIETSIHGFTESQCIHDLQDMIVKIAHVEGQRPPRIFKDKYA